MKNINSNKDLEDYIYQNNHQHEIQKELREFAFKEFGEIAHMQISPHQASFLSLLIKIGNYKKILELGTFVGYSALSMALALPRDGHLITVDKDMRTSSFARKFWSKAKIENKITLINEEAKITLDKFIEQKKFFDLIFVDADKSGYLSYFESCLSLIKNQGLIIFDNILWKGKVADFSIKDKKTESIRAFNNFVKSDNRIDTTIISIDDGMMICKKKINLKL